MKIFAEPLVLALVPFALGACAAEVAAPPVVAEVREPVVLPSSALAGAVHALERLEASRPRDVLVQVRALESAALERHEAPAGLVRVFLHLTVFAPTSERARGAFGELRAALEADAREPVELGPVATERARRVVGAPSWTPGGGEELLSYSDALRVEYVPAAEASEAEAPGAAGAAPQNVGLENYVRELAGGAGLEGLQLSIRRSDARPGVSEARCLVQDSADATGHRRANLGAFLATLENDSPAARLTELSIEHARNALDPLDESSWGFEAWLIVRVPAGG